MKEENFLSKFNDNKQKLFLNVFLTVLQMNTKAAQKNKHAFDNWAKLYNYCIDGQHS